MIMNQCREIGTCVAQEWLSFRAAAQRIVVVVTNCLLSVKAFRVLQCPVVLATCPVAAVIRGARVASDMASQDTGTVQISTRKGLW